MLSSRASLTALLSAPLLVGLSFHPPARACAPAPPPNARVQVVDESAIIVWDAATHQEHFIRRATFTTTSDDFGFLVPTPTVPALAEADDFAFKYLEQLIRPRVISQEHKSYYLSSLFFAAPQKAAAKDLPSGSVQILSTQHVAGYDAVVLFADKADALLKWLQSHGYASRPALLAWLTPYVQAHWKITAFKISKDNPRSGHTASSAVRMSFAADRPFFPYREPADQREPGNHSAQRSLRVFFLSAARMEGALGEAGGAASWPGQVVSASPIPDINSRVLSTRLALSTEQFPANMWLTTFEDRSSPRPGTDDVYFAPAAQQTPVVPPPVTVTQEQRIPIPIEPLLLMGGLGIFFWVRWRRTGNLGPSLEASR